VLTCTFDSQLRFENVTNSPASFSLQEDTVSKLLLLLLLLLLLSLFVKKCTHI